jgi:hypothetical protein
LRRGFADTNVRGVFSIDFGMPAASLSGLAAAQTALQ